MAKYVIAGKLNCPLYARAELIADELKLRLPDFYVHKIVVKSEDWNQWTTNLCKEHKWKLSEEKDSSPIIWRELINRGGKGTLLGGCNEFLEMCKVYYGVECEKLTKELLEIANENKITSHQNLEEEEKFNNSEKCYHLTIAFEKEGLSLTYNLLLHLCKCNFFTTGSLSDLELTLFTNCDDDDTTLDALAMEISDLAEPQLRKVNLIKNDLNIAFAEADFVIIISPTSILEHSTLGLLKSYSIALNSSLKQSSKVVVAGSNAMQTCYVLSIFLNKVPLENIFALSRLQENQVKSAIGTKLKINLSKITNIIVWGSEKEYIIDHSYGKAHGYNGSIWSPDETKFTYSIIDTIVDSSWYVDQANKINTQNAANILSQSVALYTQINDLITAQKENELFSIGTYSNGEFGLPKGIYFSMPVVFKNGKCIIQKDLTFSDDLLDKINKSAVKFKTECDELLNKLK